MQKITPFLWFDDQAEAAAEFYVSVFGGRMLNVSHTTESVPRPTGMVLVAKFEIEGQEFAALNGGPEYTHSPAISFAVGCETQDEIDRLWEQLSDGGEKGVCGWLTDKFGVSWQIVPAVLDTWLAADDAAALDRVMKAILGMTKLDLAILQRAYEGKL